MKGGGLEYGLEAAAIKRVSQKCLLPLEGVAGIGAPLREYKDVLAEAAAFQGVAGLFQGFFGRKDALRAKMGGGPLPFPCAAQWKERAAPWPSLRGTLAKRAILKDFSIC